MTDSGTAAPRRPAGERILEREAELSCIEELVEDVAQGSARMALIEGRAGMGKSRLLAELRSAAQAGGLRVLSARGSEIEQAFPFGAVRQLFEPLLVEPGAREHWLSGAAAPAAAVFDSPGAVEEEAPQDVSFAALHGLYWLTLNIAAEQPLLLAIDDLHWCDRPSLRFVAYLARRLEALPLGTACALRSGEPGTDPVLLGEIAQDPATLSIQPRALSEAGVSRLVAARLGDPDSAFAAACHRATGGNPLLLRQLLTSLEAEGIRPEARSAAVVRDIGPRAVSRTVLLRLARLPGEAAEVARAVAVLGQGAGLPEVAALTELTEAEVAEATAALARVEILHSEPPLGFVHPLVRDAVYRELSPSERELRHAGAARVLSDSGAAPEQIAAQLLETPQRGEPWVVDVLYEAARTAVGKGAPDSATAYLRRALEEPPGADLRPRLLLELGSTEVLSEGPAAAEHLQAAYDELADPGARGLAAGILGRALLFTNRVSEAGEIAQRAAADLPPELDDLRKGLEAFELMTIYFGAGGVERFERLHPYRRRPEGTGPGARMLAGMAAYEWLCTDGTAAETAELGLAALEGGYLTGADSSLVSFAAIATLIHADREEVMDVWAEMLEESHRRGSLFAVSSIHLWRGYTLLRRGELAEAEASLRAARGEFETWGFGEVAQQHTAAILASVLRERGELGEARAALDATLAPTTVTNGTALWLASTSSLLLAEGRAEDALEVAEELRHLCEALPDPHRLWWRSLQAEALDRLGRTDEALALARAELDVTRHYGAPGSLGRTLRILGTLEREAGVDHLRQAVEVIEGSPARLELAKALAALGSALRREREPTEAREPLRRALELAGACGAGALAEHARSELHAAGVRPRATALSGLESLTASERRVAELAAEGQTNRDIAQTLYITPKTVEVHLTNAYRKLEVRSRRELPAALSATGGS